MSVLDCRKQAARRSYNEMIRHMQAFELELKFSAGIWYFGQVNSRFHDTYKPAKDIPARLEIAGRLARYGLKGIEAHYPNEINEDNLDLWKQFIRDTGIKLVTVVPLLFYDIDFESGSLSSALPGVRKKAIQRAVRTFEICRDLKCDFSVVWPGIDGYENSFGIDFYGMRDRFASGLAEAMDRVPGMPVAFEPKPYEPRGHIIYGTTAEGILLGHKVELLLKDPANKKLLDKGHALVGMNPEVGHMLMAYEDLPYAFSLAMEYGRLFHTHWNSQPLGNYDQDLNVGVLSIEQTEAALYAMKMYGYKGYIGIDVNPERMPVETAVRNSMDAIKSAYDRVNSLDHEKVLWATEHPDRARGWLEAYMIRARSSNPKILGPVPDLNKKRRTRND